MYYAISLMNSFVAQSVGLAIGIYYRIEVKGKLLFKQIYSLRFVILQQFLQFIRLRFLWDRFPWLFACS